MNGNHWKLNLSYGSFRVPGGWCAAAWTPKGLSGLVLPQKTKSAAFKTLRKYLPRASFRVWEENPVSVPKDIQSQTKKALAGRPVSFKKYDLSFLTPYQQKILKSACLIPAGQFRTYAWTTQKAGSPRGYQAAGQALTRNPIPLLIPCHRVIARGNRLGGYGGGVEWKMKLLKSEGVEVKHGLVS
jgi:methylated-DNA-[protein]-cysteine S-methyltransferase